MTVDTISLIKSHATVIQFQVQRGSCSTVKKTSKIKEKYSLTIFEVICCC